MNKKQITMVTVALMLGNVMAGLDGTITNTAIPAIVSALHGIQFMGWIVAIYLLGMSVSIPIWTKIGEKITNKLAFEIALVLFVLGSTLEGLAPNIYFFLVCPNDYGNWWWRNGVLALYYCRIRLSKY